MSHCLALAMPDVLIVTGTEASAVSERMASALVRPILASSATVEIETERVLQRKLVEGTFFLGDRVLCPLTFNLPNSLKFPQQRLYAACRDVLGLRQRAEQALHCSTGTGRFWLPIVLTAKGALYAETIAPIAYATPTENLGYLQPFHLPDRWRQPLYQFGQRLLKLLTATPAVYLIQFGFQQKASASEAPTQNIVFDRVFPFPAAPAIASINVQSPDLFACHWACLTNQPILDLTIVPPQEYQSLQSL